VADAPDDALRRLRDRTATTRLLILAELERRPGATLSDAAVALGITVQAVSAHARHMAGQGWLRMADGAYRATPKGLQVLHEGVRHLRDAIASLAQPLDVIQVTSAIAAGPVRTGQAVGLFMDEGDLAARAGLDSPSSGVARNDAKPGQEVVVGRLQGMVRLEPGRLTLVSGPGPAEGGVAGVDVDALRRQLGREPTRRMGAHGTGARILARALAQAGTGRLDFEFAADRAAFNAAERGLDALLFVTRDRLPEVVEAFERPNGQTLRRVPIELVEAPEHHA
jgi:predicted transcriptional regulator